MTCSQRSLCATSSAQGEGNVGVHKAVVHAVEEVAQYLVGFFTGHIVGLQQYVQTTQRACGSVFNMVLRAVIDGDQCKRLHQVFGCMLGNGV